MSIIPETPAERRQRLLDERQRGSTFHQHGVAAVDDEAGGRFGLQEGARAQVIGTMPVPFYPPSALSGQLDAGTTPFLPVHENFAFEPSTVLSPSSAEDPGGPMSAAPSNPPRLQQDVERDVGPPSFPAPTTTNED